MKKTNILRSTVIPLFVTMMWGVLYPLVKISYAAFEIDSTSVPDIIMFAALRFVICGIIVCIVSFLKKEKIEAPLHKSIFLISLSGFFAIFLHFAFVYVGLISTDSSKTALIKQLGVLLYVCFAFLFIKEEKFNKFKIIGAIIGFIGIAAINYTGKSIVFSKGDILIMLASICTVVSSILINISVKESSPYWVSGIAQLVGGILLLLTGLIMGGKFPIFNPEATLIFAYICIASIAGYILWYSSMKHISVSTLFIIKFAEPLFACIFGAIMLGENIFKIQYLLAFILISLGITLGNRN